MGRNESPSRRKPRSRSRDREVRERSRSRDRMRRERERDRGMVKSSRDRVERTDKPRDKERDRERERDRSKRDSKRRKRSGSREKRSSKRSRSRSRSRSVEITSNLETRAPITAEELEGKSNEEAEMMKLMGFGSFDTTKGQHVHGNEEPLHGTVQKVLKRKYRQYMNRKGGFNRPLDPIA